MEFEEFIGNIGMRPWSLYVKHPDFASLYIRRGPFYANGAIHHDYIVIANVEAKFKGKGAFTDLVEHITDFGLKVAVEGVMSKRFRKHLESVGFERTLETQNNHLSPTYVLCSKGRSGSEEE